MQLRRRRNATLRMRRGDGRARRLSIPALIFLAGFSAAAAQTAPPTEDKPAPAARPVAPGVVIPDFWNPRARGERVEAPQTGKPVRFLTDDEFPPLHFAGPDGNPTGFAVELSRAVCEKLTISCTVQVRRFDTLLDALEAKQGDVVAAAIPLSEPLRGRFLATRPYFRWPARFAARNDRGLPAPTPETLKGKTVAVIEGSAHAAYLKAYFRDAEAKPVSDVAAAVGAVKRGEADYVFADGLNLALWIGGQDSENCCAFSGGDYLENRYFGEGIGLITRTEDLALSRALDDALQRVWDDGKYAELYLRFFPVSPF